MARGQQAGPAAYDCQDRKAVWYSQEHLGRILDPYPLILELESIQKSKKSVASRTRPGRELPKITMTMPPAAPCGYLGKKWTMVPMVRKEPPRTAIILQKITARYYGLLTLNLVKSTAGRLFPRARMASLYFVLGDKGDDGTHQNSKVGLSPLGEEFSPR